MDKTAKIILGVLAVGLGAAFLHKAVSAYLAEKKDENVYTDERLIQAISTSSLKFRKNYKDPCHQANPSKYGNLCSHSRS